MVLNYICTLVSVLVLIVVHVCDAGQTCSSCSGIELAEGCGHHIKCNDNEMCFIHQYTTESGIELSDLGCTASQACPHSIVSIFGRRAEGHRIKCSACCNDTALCNKNMTCGGSVNTGILPKECSDLDIPIQHRHSEPYTIYPYGVLQSPVSVYCLFDGNDAWTVFQRRFNGSVDFYRNWAAYKTGFGTVDGEYWLGNEIIHTLTAQGNHELKIVLTDFSNAAKYALYSSFRIADESHWYQLSVLGYSGTAGDAFSVHNGMKFSTFDRDNDASRLHHCAQSYKGAWWYKECHDSNLNGHYYTGQHKSYADGIEWHQWHGYHYSLRTTTMMIKRK